MTAEKKKWSWLKVRSTQQAKGGSIRNTSLALSSHGNRLRKGSVARRGR